MSYPREENNRMISLLHLLVQKKVLTKKEAIDLFQKGKLPITDKMKKNTKYIWD
jgi:hypothetical protein